MEITMDQITSGEDQELMEGLMQRVPQALERLHRRYRTVLRSIIMQVLHDEAEAEDVLQEVFLQVWDRADSYSPRKGKLVSWLCTLARRRAIDRLRQHSAYRRATDRYEVSCNHPDKAVDETHVVERDAFRDDIRELLHQQIATLPPKQQQVIRLAYFENRSQREISALTDTPLGTVKTRIELGMKKLTHAFGGLRDKLV
ncbi:RNA polymerase sigma-70 factor, ECF subfamily [Terrimicrobium sacchariphilum]|uniref:RNA polymerase sigma-70 factor, ECF subfamily n=2 Tax=Terrimicrobium sacchariphilum TaxID=690879 RepID=A0A146G6G2_TERSA|nr:RNA polymerase sigma-70 factor, ECF subfamily [Terrimicrobium sacchariphilum]